MSPMTKKVHPAAADHQAPTCAEVLGRIVLECERPSVSASGASLPLELLEDACAALQSQASGQPQVQNIAPLIECLEFIGRRMNRLSVLANFIRTALDPHQPFEIEDADAIAEMIDDEANRLAAYIEEEVGVARYGEEDAAPPALNDRGQE